MLLPPTVLRRAPALLPRGALVCLCGAVSSCRRGGIDRDVHRTLPEKGTRHGGLLEDVIHPKLLIILDFVDSTLFSFVR